MSNGEGKSVLVSAIALTWVEDGEQHSLVFHTPEKIKALLTDDANTLGAFLRAAIARDASILPLPVEPDEEVEGAPQPPPDETAISIACESCDTHVHLGVVSNALLTDSSEPGRCGAADSKLFDEIFELPEGWARIKGHPFCGDCKDNPRVAIKWACDGTCSPRATAIAGHLPLDYAAQMEVTPVDLDGRTVAKLDPSAHVVGDPPEGWTMDGEKQFCPVCSTTS